MPALRPSWLTGPADQNQKQIKIKGTQPRWRSTAATGAVALLFCGSGLAREKPESAALNQDAHVIVNDLREQARSHIWTVPALAFDFALQHSSRPVGRCALAVDLDFDLRRPVKPRWLNAGFGAWVTRQDAGLAALGQGWPIAAAHGPKPWRAHRAWARCRVVGQERFAYFCAVQK